MAWWRFPATYLRLADNFNVRPLDDKLAQIVQALDREANAQSLPNQWLASLLANYQLQPEQEITTTPYFQTLLKPLLTTQLRPVVTQLQALAEQTGLEKLQAVLDIALPMLTTMMVNGEVSGTWAELQQATDESAWGTNPRKTKQWTEQDLADVETFKALRQQIKGIHQTYLAASATQVKTLLALGKTLLTDLIAITKDYRRAYQQAKARRQMLDFGDLEHYAFAILTGRNRFTQELDPAKQSLAQKVRQELQQHYRELMIDEYQDTNRLQADLLAQIHNEEFNHYFMVGDMKQSIYRFRQADPTLFLENYQAYQDGQTSHETLDLSDNYRSMTNVTDFTNLIFKQLMDQELGEMDYDQKASLTPKAQWVLADDTTAQPTPVEMLVYNQQTGDELDDRAGEVQMIATRIKQMLAPNSPERIYDADLKAMRPIKAGDIAILARTKVLNQAISEQFSQVGIPVTMHGIENYFKATEVRTMLSLLRVLDNPYQDVPLVSTMRAPLFKYQAADQPATFGFTEPELAQLRLQVPTGNFYQVLQTMATMTVPAELDRLQAKVQAFLTFLTTLQHQAQQQSLVELIWNIYQQTGYLEYVGGMPGGVQRQANLHALYERAGAYEESSFKGLYQFIQFIEKMQRNDDDLGVAAVEKDPNTVNVMTIHGSKGLQFPIVFVAHTTGQFRNEAADFVVAAKDGVGFTVRTNLHPQVPSLPDAEIDYPVPQLATIKEIKKRQSRAEEMRLLYVALTRAEQRLIITGVVKDNWKAYQKNVGASSRYDNA
ncbi:3'-5' exonuclease [Limosilactobacillus equigenerosi]|uniref:3'-5' exonuclease n=1 Tax=Limosilactobacillus equigenerosi TaxID=417373 RepID=UPI0006CFB868|nr:3'-5' exonuclease [Limosilactobacillus equigenerosi]